MACRGAPVIGGLSFTPQLGGTYAESGLEEMMRYDFIVAKKTFHP